jgi:hypothetical protein
MKAPIDAETLRELLDYDPETGVFRWKVNRPGGKAKAGNVAGFNNGDGYLRIGICGHMVLAHRLAWLHAHGEWPRWEIDHINGRLDDNKVKNLRDVNHCENTRNAKIRKDNTSGINGVGWSNRTNQFCAHISVCGRQIHLGFFDTIEAAAAARKTAERKYGYHQNHGRARPK